MGRIEKTARAPAIAVTGGIACGKSEVGKILAAEGAQVCDADEVSRRQMVPGEPVFERVVARFGREMLDETGHVDRSRLARYVFAREDEREALNAITHPPVMDEIRDWVALTRARGQVAVAIVPLLFEVGAETEFDAVICVAAGEDTVLRRLKTRGLDEPEARRRMAAQWPQAEKIRHSDHVIYNDSDMESLRDRTRKVYRDILKKERDEHG